MSVAFDFIFISVVASLLIGAASALPRLHDSMNQFHRGRKLMVATVIGCMLFANAIGWREPYHWSHHLVNFLFGLTFGLASWEMFKSSSLFHKSKENHRD